jgi:hypothetical protein
MKKICNKCFIKREINDFDKRKDSKDGFRNECKFCRRKIKNDYTNRNKEKVLLLAKKWRENNPEKVKNRTKKYHELNRDKEKKYKKQKYHSDSFYRMKECVRARMRRFFDINNINKNNKTFDIVGCTPEELKIHLEKKFTKDMSWENYGYYGWHIDHIIPLSFGKTEKEIYQLCHYTNLQPMWWTENFNKSDNI